MTQFDERPAHDDTNPASDTQGYMKPVYDDGTGDKSRPGAGSLDDPINGGLIPFRTMGPTVSNGYIVNGTTYPYP
jgi:hypothetical protein